jgi:hypothetical protein
VCDELDLDLAEAQRVAGVVDAQVASLSPVVRMIHGASARCTCTGTCSVSISLATPSTEWPIIEPPTWSA